MTERTQVHGLQVATSLFRFVEDKVLPGTGVGSEAFWKGFDAIVADLAPRNIALLAERDRLQTELDTWHKANPGPITDMVAYRSFLEKIGYLVPQPADVKATTANVDDELATQAGPQLVTDLLQKASVSHHVLDGAGVGLVPGVQLGLQAVALGQQGNVARGQVGHDGVKALPEGGGIHPRAGQHLVFDKAVQGGGHLQAVNLGAIGHGVPQEEW